MAVSGSITPVFGLRTLDFGLILGVFALAFLSGSSWAAPTPPWVGQFTAARVITASSPDNTYIVLRKLIDSAKSSIHVAVYQLDNPFVGDALERALSRGVQVRLLVEGAPIPKVAQGELYIVSRLVKKGAKALFYDDPDGRAKRQFKYFHNKYCVVDGKRVIVGSANYGMNGHPTINTMGNREWEVVLDDPQAAELFEKAFEHDAMIPGEWAKYGSNKRYTLEDPDYEPDRTARKGKYDLNLEPIVAHDVPVKTVFAPDNSLGGGDDPDGPMLRSLKAARETVDVEQLNFETYWGQKAYNPEKQESLMMSAILQLARSGRSIRVLLNDDNVFREPQRPPRKLAGGLLSALENVASAAFGGDDFAQDPSTGSGGHDERNNEATLAYLNKIAKKEGLDLTVRLLDYKRCGLGVLHNKGMIVDHDVALVGSLNWGESALKFNREAGVLMKSAVVARYYGRAFDYDWKCSE